MSERDPADGCEEVSVSMLIAKDGRDENGLSVKINFLVKCYRCRRSEDRGVLIQNIGQRAEIEMYHCGLDGLLLYATNRKEILESLVQAKREAVGDFLSKHPFCSPLRAGPKHPFHDRDLIHAVPK